MGEVGHASSVQSVVTFAHNLCLATAPSDGKGLLLAERVGSDQGPSLIADNIADAYGHALDLGSWYWNGSGPTALSNNDFIARGAGACTVYDAAGSGCKSDPNAGTKGMVTLGNNVALAPTYAAPVPTNPTAAGYSLGGACNLGGLGVTVPSVPTDYTSAPRDTPPAIGPTECP